jgi:hypothetical protein
MREGPLELVGQATFEVGCGGAAEQVGDDAGVGLEGADLAVVPVSGLGRVQVQAADRPAVQLDRHAHPGLEP